MQTKSFRNDQANDPECHHARVVGRFIAARQFILVEREERDQQTMWRT